MPDPIGQPTPLASLTRRALLPLAASAAALTVAGPLFAQTAADPAVERFLTLSRKLTAYDDLNPITAARILAALTAQVPAYEDAITHLAALADTAADAQQLRAQADTAGLLPALTAVLTAWYTGTVASDTGTVVVAYHDALMYRPTADGLVVPTYCNKGPMWWQDTLPPEVTRTPVNFPKVL